MKYIPLKNTLLEGWAKKDGKTHCLTWRAYKNTRDDGVKHGMIIEHFYCAHFVKRNPPPPLLRGSIVKTHYYPDG